MGLSLKRRLLHCLLFALLLPALLGCTPQLPLPGTPAPTQGPQPTPYQETMVTFRVSLPAPLPPGDSIYLTVLDEVTGLALNPQKFVMQAEDARHYLVILPFPLRSVIKYRYERQGGSLAQEHIPDGRPVRYRLYLVDGPGFVDDTVSRWTDTDFTGETGRLMGRVVEAQSGKFLPGILITAGGAQTYTKSDGSYLLEGLVPGVHTVVAYALDGRHQVYQQGARIAAGSATPAPLTLEPAPLVQVTFNVSVPAGTLPAVPLRLAGNLYPLGNTFADLAGGVNTVAARLPVFTPLGGGRYSLTLDLPAGTDLRYKYTLGDGLWNAEHTLPGDFRLRQLIVPDRPVVLEDRVETWSRGRSAPITFDVSVPAYTPVEEGVSIQFNPGHAWTEPLPMWPAGNGRWIYVLYSPIDPLGSIRYRYCRNEQCSNADDRRSSGTQAVGLPASSSLLPSTLDDRVENWTWLENITTPTTLPNVQIRPRGQNFITGVEFQPLYHPSWNPRLGSALADVRAVNAAWVVLTPTWTYTQDYPPVLEPLPGRDQLWPDLQYSLALARSQSLSTAIFPTPNFPTPAPRWWTDARRDFPFWITWFEGYRDFLLHHADIAEQTGARALIVGGDWLTPALPGGLLADGSPSHVPDDAEARWRSLLEEVRGRYSGELLWAAGFPHGVEDPVPFIDLFDRLYLAWAPPLQESLEANEVQMAQVAARLLDETAAPFYEATGKSIVLGLAYPSATGWLAGCARSGSRCVELDSLARPNTDFPDIPVNLDDQVRAYNAVLLAVNERDWISGVVSRGYYPPAVLHDKSASIHGKPARGVLWYWFPRLRGD